MKAPEPLYPCCFCSEDYSWPATDLNWSERQQSWVCGMCWDDPYENGEDETIEERGVSLAHYLAEQKEAELATLRAKAEAWDKGRTKWIVYNNVGQQTDYFGETETHAINMLRASCHIPEPWTEYLRAGYTCSKVRVCEVVE